MPFFAPVAGDCLSVNVKVSGRFRKITLIPLSTWAERENGAAHVFSFDVR